MILWLFYFREKLFESLNTGKHRTRWKITDKVGESCSQSCYEGVFTYCLLFLLREREIERDGRHLDLMSDGCEPLCKLEWARSYLLFEVYNFFTISAHFWCSWDNLPKLSYRFVYIKANKENANRGLAYFSGDIKYLDYNDDRITALINVRWVCNQRWFSLRNAGSASSLGDIRDYANTPSTAML